MRFEEKFCRGCGANSSLVAHEYRASAPEPALRAVATAAVSNRAIEQMAASYTAATAARAVAPAAINNVQPVFDDFFDAAPTSAGRTAAQDRFVARDDDDELSSRVSSVMDIYVNEPAETPGTAASRPRKSVKRSSSDAMVGARNARRVSDTDAKSVEPASKKQKGTSSRLWTLCGAVAIVLIGIGLGIVLLKPNDSSLPTTAPSTVSTSSSSTPFFTSHPATEANVFPSRSRRDRLVVNREDSKEEAIKMASISLAVGLVIGGFLFLASVKLFGVNGLLNVIEKNKYIPSQYKKQHCKIMNELGARPQKGSVPLGSRYEWRPAQCWLPRDLSLTAARRNRNPNILVLGGAGHGKSRLVEAMIRKDIEHDDRAVVVIDSDGSLVDRLINWIAVQDNCDELLDRVRVVDPCAADTTIGFNPLLVEDEENLNQVASAVVSAFKCIYMESPGAQNQWTQQTANILRNALILLGLNSKSLADLPRLLSDNDFRDLCLRTLESRKKDPQAEALLDAWANYKKMARSENWINWIEPILNRLQPVIADVRIRRLLCERENSLDMTDVLVEKRIVLVKVPRVRLEQGSGILGSLIVTGVKQAAVQIIASRNKNPFPCAIYLDELGDFVDKDCFESIAADSRQLQVGITAVMRSMQTVPDDFKSALNKNIGLFVTFALMRKDAELLGPQMFRVDGRKTKTNPLPTRANPIGSSPTFELISDEQSLSVDRLTGQEERTFFCYLAGSEAGVFKLRAPQVEDVPPDSVDPDIVEQLYCADFDEEA